MTVYEMITILIGIIALLISLANFIVALLTFLDERK